MTGADDERNLRPGVDDLILHVASRYTRSRWDYIAGVGIRLALKPRERRP